MSFEVDCFQRIYCVTALDGCPPAYCTGSGDTCAWKTSALQAEAQACSQNTTSDTCSSPLCNPSNHTCVASGSWSCDLSFGDTGLVARGYCESWSVLGFGCVGVYE